VSDGEMVGGFGLTVKVGGKSKSFL